MYVFSTILALQEEELHHDFVRIAGVDFALKENDSVFKEQISQRHLTLALVALMRVGIKHGLHVWKVTQLIFPYSFE
jgi:hypothetical protein